MRRARCWQRLLVVLTGWLLMAHTPAVLGCAACFGKSDSAMARGMNMGIFSLLVVVVCVLSSVAGFFFYLARRGAKMETQPEAREIAEPITRT
jgi:hypothetical protein